MAEHPKSFDEGLPQYVEALCMAYQQTGDIPSACSKVSALREFTLNLPTDCGINKHFRIEQAETKALKSQPAIKEAPLNGESHDWKEVIQV